MEADLGLLYDIVGIFGQNQQPGAEEAFKILGHAFDLIGDAVSIVNLSVTTIIAVILNTDK